MRIAGIAIGVILLAGCTTPLERGERSYREGDRVAALETWRRVPESHGEWEQVRQRIGVVEAEFQKLVVRYKKRARYFEGLGRLGESILNYRLALKLQPDDAANLAHVQKLARTLAARKVELKRGYRGAFVRGDLPTARRRLSDLRTLDPFDPQLASDEQQLGDALRVAVSKLMASGRRGFAAGDYDASTRAFRAVLDHDPDNESARGYLSYIATIRSESERFGKAPAAFVPPGRFATDAEIRAEGFYQNALAADRSGDSFAAIRHDQRALQADPDHAPAARHLAAVRRRMAAQVDVLVEAGRKAFREEDLQSALDRWREALLVDPDNERAIAYIGRAERQLQNLERLRSEPDVATGSQ